MSEEQKQKLRESYQKRREEALAKGVNALSVGGYGIVSLKKIKHIQVAYCTGCARNYLPKLGCLWCNKYDKYTRTP